MISQPSLMSLEVIEDSKTKKMSAVWGLTWGSFFTEIWRALFAWKHSFTGTVIFDFGSISAQSQAVTTMTLNGVRTGDAVIVRPTTAVNGIILDGTVTSDNTVTIRAVNYSSGVIDPASQTYRVLVFQQ